MYASRRKTCNLFRKKRCNADTRPSCFGRMARCASSGLASAFDGPAMTIRLFLYCSKSLVNKILLCKIGAYMTTFFNDSPLQEFSVAELNVSQDEITFVIPSYQRGYRWTTTNDRPNREKEEKEEKGEIELPRSFRMPLRARLLYLRCFRFREVPVSCRRARFS